MKPELSLIVGYRNRDTERLSWFLQSLAEQRLQNFELVFVDYGSELETATKVKALVAQFHFAHYHYFDTRGLNWNRSRCLNEAAKIAKGSFFFTCDVDFVFADNFTEHLSRYFEQPQGYYFKVGFLAKAQRDFKHLQEKDAQYFSDEDAIGATLLPRSTFESIGGFDEYYEIWGLEDNDLLYRLRKAGHTMKFESGGCYIFHMWHLPAKKDTILPEGWLKLLSDYLKAKQNGWIEDQVYYSPLDRRRPLMAEHSQKSSTLIVKNCSRFFLRELLDYKFKHLANGEILHLQFDFEDYFRFKNTTANRLKSKLNALLKRVGLPFRVQLIFSENYLSPTAAKDELQYFLKRERLNVQDYYLPHDLIGEQFKLMKDQHDI